MGRNLPLELADKRCNFESESEDRPLRSIPVIKSLRRGRLNIDSTKKKSHSQLLCCSDLSERKWEVAWDRLQKVAVNTKREGDLVAKIALPLEVRRGCRLERRKYESETSSGESTNRRPCNV